MSSLRLLNRGSLAIACALFFMGIGALALSVERPMSSADWQIWVATGEAPRLMFTGVNDPASRGWSYETYLTNAAIANRAKGSCGFASMDGQICALNGFVAPINWLAMLFTVIGVAAFVRLREGNNSTGVYAP